MLIFIYLFIYCQVIYLAQAFLYRTLWIMLNLNMQQFAASSSEYWQNRQKPPYLADFYLTNAEIRATTTWKNIWRTDSMIIQNERTLHFALTSRPMFLVRQAGVLEWIEIVLQVKNTLPALFLISLRIRDGDLFYCIR